MEAGMRDLHAGWNPAKPGLPLQPVHPAFARAAFTGCQSIHP